MSEERDLLRKLFEAGMLDRLLAIEVGQLLAQPEQEPLSEDEIFNIGYKAGFAIDHVESDDGESTDYGFIDGDGYIDNDLVFKFVRAIEKAYGIGGEE